MKVLSCQTCSGSVFDVAPGKNPVTGFYEQGRYFLSVDGDVQCRLLIDEVEPPRTDSSKCNSWEWQPGFYAGEVKAELFSSSGSLISSYIFDVSPSPEKLGSKSFQAMVDELYEFAPRLLTGSEAAMFGIGVDGAVTEPHLEYSRLRRYSTQLLAALKALTVAPLTQLVHDRAWLPAHQVKRLDARSMISIVRSPSALAKLQGSYYLDNEQQALFDVARSREALDIPANRTIYWVLHAVLSRARLVADALTKIADKEKVSATKTAFAPRLAYRLEFLLDLELNLKKLAKQSPFSDLTRREVSVAGLNVISAHPLYSRAFRTGWKILRPGIAGEREDEMLWMSPTWEVYERWCFLKIFGALELAFPNFTWQQHYPSSRENCIMFSGSDESATVNLYYQAKFPAYDQPQWESFSSISGERYPDIVVTYLSGVHRRFLVVDAKYRASRQNVLDAMQSAHLYRDSLRWNGAPPHKALLVIPAGGGTPWLEETEFLDKHGVGVLPLSPDSIHLALSGTLEAMLLQ